MTRHPVAVLRTGLVTSVGMTAAQSCAAFRAKVSNPSPTGFVDSKGDWINAHQVSLDVSWRGLPKLARMAAMAIDDALVGIPTIEWARVPLLLCVAEQARPGRASGLDDLPGLIQSQLGAAFGVASAVVPHGRVGVAIAFEQARRLLAARRAQRVLVAATDSLLSWPTLSRFDRQDRLLKAGNSNGFVPGEAAGAILLGATPARHTALVCEGIGLGHEKAHVDTDAPLKADGLSTAVRTALADAGRQMHDMDFRITDNAGEHYYFKESSLMLARMLHVRKEEFDIWHPSECIGEVGAASGIAIIATALAACEKGYAKGPSILAHMGNDAGERAALALRAAAMP